MTVVTHTAPHEATHDTSGLVNVAPVRASSVRRWIGRVLHGLAVLFLAFDVVFKLVQHPSAIEGTVALGYPPSAVLTIGILGLVCWVLYVVPRTSVLGAVLWTGYLGGAIATHVRLENPLFTHTLFPVYVAALIWGSLYLRDPRLRDFLPFRRNP
jgi:hypothetical protein